MKVNAGVAETIVVSTAEIAENLVKFKWSKIGKMLFSARQKKIKLLEGELTSPGSEVAYIFQMKQVFQS